jgi:hypothetical protein
MIVELQATISSLFHTTKTFVPTFVPTITEEVRDLPVPTNDENLKPMCKEDIVSHYSSLSPNDA